MIYPEKTEPMLSSNKLYTTGLKIRWDSIAEDSYLRNITKMFISDRGRMLKLLLEE